MIKVNTKDGKTLSYDLSLESDYIEATELVESKDSTDSVTGISILHNTFWHALPKPRKFRKIRYFVKLVKHTKDGVEKVVGEKIICQADDIQLSILVYYNQRPKMARIEIKRIGRQRFVPVVSKGEATHGTHKED